MTGFGEGRIETPAGTARVGLAAVNHRGLAVVVRGDLRDQALEEQVREAIRRSLGRGSVTVQLSWEPAGAAGLDRQRVAAVWRDLAALAAEIGAPMPTLTDALAQAGRPREDASAASAPVRQALAQAVERLDAARLTEGAALRVAFRAISARLRGLLPRMQAAQAARVPLVHEQLQARVQALVGSQVPPESLAREVALEVQRIDVSEELTRLAAHLDALDILLAKDEPVGRELEFLAQELAREANTCTTKANDPALSALGIEAKVAIDQLKEQAANVM